MEEVLSLHFNLIMILQLTLQIVFANHMFFLINFQLIVYQVKCAVLIAILDIVKRLVNLVQVQQLIYVILAFLIQITYLLILL